jgi:plasmid stabilization system protein ParE
MLLLDYISQDSPRYAVEFGERVFKRVDQLREFPFSERVVSEFSGQKLRELIMNKYRIVYRIYSEKVIVIIRIIHGSKLID